MLNHFTRRWVGFPHGFTRIGGRKSFLDNTYQISNRAYNRLWLGQGVLIAWGLTQGADMTIRGTLTMTTRHVANVWILNSPHMD